MARGWWRPPSSRSGRRATLWLGWQTGALHCSLPPPSHPVPKGFAEIPSTALVWVLRYFFPRCLLKPHNWLHFLQFLLSSIYPLFCYIFLSKANLTMLFILITLSGYLLPMGETLNSWASCTRLFILECPTYPTWSHLLLLYKMNKGSNEWFQNNSWLHNWKYLVPRVYRELQRSIQKEASNLI